MLKNYFKTSFRNLLRYKGYSFINIAGLAIGLTSSILILLWVADELSFDRFHKDADRIYQVMINNTFPDGRIDTYAATPSKLKAALVDEIPEIESAALYSMQTQLLIKHKTNGYNEIGIYAEPTLFDIFSFDLINGSNQKPLPDIKSIAISEELAKKLFNTENPIGKTVQINQENEFKVSTVFANIPQNSSLQFDFVIPFEVYSKENPWMQSWQSGGTRTLVKLNATTHVETANQKMAGIIEKNCSECSISPFLFPYVKSRLYTEFVNGKNVGGRIDQVLLFATIAILILLMACINFMNLSTARSASRSREVGVRKSIGAQKTGLVFQFIMESVLQSFLAMYFALIIIQLLLPFFNEITGKSMVLDFTNPTLSVGIISITLLCGLLAGSYPAFILSRFNPIQVLKGDKQFGAKGNNLRKILVIFQFSVSIILVVGSVAVYKQIGFISEKNLGFKKDNIIVVDQNEGIVQNYSAIKNELQQQAFIKNIAFGGSNVFTIPIVTTDPVWKGKPDNSSIKFKIFRCDEAFIPTMDIKLLAGRNFIEGKDATNYIVNRKALEVMGLDLENAIGAPLEMWPGKGQIVGITEDFHNGNLKFGIRPLILMYSENLGAHYFIKLDGQLPLKESIVQIGSIFKKYNPDYPFEFTFLDEIFAKEYQTENVIAKLSLSFTVIAILISCLGLFGLASFTAERRTKELGIRKIMGASVVDLIVMLYKDFTVLLFISLLIGLPIAWYFIADFLTDYAFHANINWSIYVFTAAFMLLITLLSIGYQSIMAAKTNPVNTLRNE